MVGMWPGVMGSLVDLVQQYLVSCRGGGNVAWRDGPLVDLVQ